MDGGTAVSTVDYSDMNSPIIPDDRASGVTPVGNVAALLSLANNMTVQENCFK
jgi:hypothetical protein